MNSSEKTAALLKLLGREPYVHGVTELGEKIQCSKSGTFKLLASFCLLYTSSADLGDSGLYGVQYAGVRTGPDPVQ